ncbi:uncharacterized protein B4U79_02665, partial [Dinothrombium tinctorium]
SILRKCVICQRFNVTHADEVMAPLPKDRVTKSRPFHVTGIDFAGPIYTKGNAKSYICLFTCAITRAVHLELVSDMTTECFVLSLKRFIARRGVPHVIWSDNGRTFKRAESELIALYKCLNQEKAQSFLIDKGIKWKFIVERAPWWGGFWERMVRSVKTVLKKCLGKASLSFEEICTLLAEIEAILNSRPLTYMYDEPNEQVLTPSHLLMGSRLNALPTPDYYLPVEGVSKEMICRKWRYRQKLVDHFWKRWQKEYLLELRNALFNRNTKRTREMNEGDLVLIREDNIPRQMWKMGKILEKFQGRDGKVRSCKLRIAGGKEVCRPIQRLFPLELDVSQG